MDRSIVSNGHLGTASTMETIQYESDEDSVMSTGIIRVLPLPAKICRSREVDHGHSRLAKIIADGREI